MYIVKNQVLIRVSNSFHYRTSLILLIKPCSLNLSSSDGHKNVSLNLGIKKRHLLLITSKGYLFYFCFAFFFLIDITLVIFNTPSTSVILLQTYPEINTDLLVD